MKAGQYAAKTKTCIGVLWKFQKKLSDPVHLAVVLFLFYAALLNVVIVN